jgi:hypothetical protein
MQKDLQAATLAPSNHMSTCACVSRVTKRSMYIIQVQHREKGWAECTLSLRENDPGSSSTQICRQSEASLAEDAQAAGWD